ncbi:type VI secretion system Vgr family protein, partial [Roseateles sp. BYS180W]
NGDPDRPLITGRVHNALNMPSWELPEQHALTGLRSRELTPGGGNAAAGRSNHLILDDTAQSIQVQLKSDHQHSQLSLGDITRIDSHSGRQDARGQGFELRTDGHGAVRAKDGLLITTEARPAASAHHTDLKETAARLGQAQGQHFKLAELAQTHRAQGGQDQLETAKELQAQWREVKGNDRAAPRDELQAPHLVLASPAGIASTTEGSTHQHSQGHHAVTAERHISLSSEHSLLASAKAAIKLFAYKAGVKLISAKADIDVQALEQNLRLLAKLDITQQANRIHITAQQEVVINGAGS